MRNWRRLAQPNFALTKSKGNVMKILLKGWAVLFVALAAGWGGGSAWAQPTFNINPTSVSNTYDGSITLQIAGLSSGETVVVQKFLDLNANGVVDSNDLPVEQFDLTDGQPGMVIGGVTNFNVPGDFDGSVNGQITATLAPDPEIPQHIVGAYLFKLSTPSGAVTNSFTVTNFPFAQSLLGTVRSNSTTVSVPYAVVVLFAPSSGGDHGPGSPVAATVANGIGLYAIQLPPGNYIPVAFKDGYATQFSTSPVVTTNTTGPVYLILTNATESISGRLVDINTGAGIPGIFNGNGSANGYIALSFTDTNGDFTEHVVPDYWQFDGEPQGLAVQGYVGYNGKTNIDATGSSVLGLTLGFHKGNALIYGTVKDGNGQPLPGIDIYANDTFGEFQADGYTDGSGHYFVAVLGGVSGDTWQAQVSSDNAPANYIFSQPAFDQNGGTNLSAGQAAHVNFTGLLATNHITGNVQFNGTNVVGVGLSASATVNGVDFNAYTDTDTNGNYSLKVANSNVWSVSVNCGGGNDSLDNILGSGNYQCPDNQNIGITNNNGTANFTVQPVQPVQPLQISTTSLPDGTVGVYYDQSLGASGGQPPYIWWLPGGTITLPPGMSGDMNFSSDGTNATISGIPGTAGTYHFWVEVADNASPQNTVSNMFSITIQPSASPLQITTMSLPNGTNTLFYSQTLQASGGTPPYTWRIPNYSQNPPPDLTLTTNGVLSGTISTNDNTYTFDVELDDNAAGTVYQPLNLTVVSPPLTITNTSLPAGTVGAAYSAQLGATGGHPPYSWQLAAGSNPLPSGLELNSGSGLISGTPAAGGTNYFRVEAYDGWPDDATKVLSIAVHPRPTISSPAVFSGNDFQMIVNVAANQNYTVQMSTNLASTNWIPLLMTNPSSGTFLFDDPNATNPARYYRVWRGP
jgi:Putative Ig domain